MEFSIQDLLPNITFKASRSGGKGGQNVNKVSSKVELNFDYQSSAVFDIDEKELLKRKFSSKMTSDGLIQVVSEEERSQYLNKERTLQKLIILLKNALHKNPVRRATKPKRAAIEKRLSNKYMRAMKKISRRKRDFD